MFKKTVFRILDFFVLSFAWPAFFKFWKAIHYISLRFMGVGNYDEKGKLTGENWVLKKILNQHSVKNFFDVGANLGQNSVFIKNSHPDILVYAFEAHPKTFKKLSEIAHNYQGFNAYNLAVGNDSGSPQTVSIYDYGNQDGSEHATLVKEVFADVYQADDVTQYEVELISILQFCKDHGIESISFLKVDTEGSELDVLRGLGTEIKIDFIQFEFNIMNLGRNRFYDFWTLLNKDFQIYRLLPSGLARIEKYIPALTEIYAYQNFLAIRNGIKF